MNEISPSRVAKLEDQYRRLMDQFIALDADARAALTENMMDYSKKRVYLPKAKDEQELKEAMQNEIFYYQKHLCAPPELKAHTEAIWRVSKAALRARSGQY